MSAKKLGRPTNNPRPHKLSLRLNDKSKQTLEAYCLQESVNITTAIERSLEKLADDLKK